MTSNTRVHLLATVSLLLAAIGCDDGPQLVPVHGTVLYQDQPLKYGSVMFQPRAGGELARGQVQADGTFSLTTRTKDDGVQIGNSRVRITAFEAQRPGGPPSSDIETTLGASAIPEMYQSFGTSGISVEITPEMELPLILRLE